MGRTSDSVCLLGARVNGSALYLEDACDIGRKINIAVCVDRPVASVISLTVVIHPITCLL